MHIDWWTLALQTINVLILIWLLSRFLYRPVVALVDRRHAEVRKLLDDAENARREAEALRAGAIAREAGIAAERERLLVEAHAAAQALAAAELATVAERAAKLQAGAADDIARARAAAERELIGQARELVIEVSRRLLTRLPPSITLAAFADGLCAEVRNLPPQLRAGMSDEVVLITAAPLAADVLAWIHAALLDAFGRPLSLTPQVDPAVIAGFELQTTHAVIRNSWRADFDRIAKELKSDCQQPRETRGLAATGQIDR